MDLKELLASPGTAPFSRIKYLHRLGYDDQIAEFVNGLFQAAVESRYKGDWDQTVELLDRWEEVAVGLQFQSMRIPALGPIPWSRFVKPLRRSKIALVTTGGVFVEGQERFCERGDDTFREIPSETPGEKFRIWHPGYDTGPATEDINCIFPLDRFKELEAEGTIGRLAQQSYSFMGLIPDPTHLIQETAPEVGRRLLDAGVDAVFLAST